MYLNPAYWTFKERVCIINYMKDASWKWLDTKMKNCSFIHSFIYLFIHSFTHAYLIRSISIFNFECSRCSADTQQGPFLILVFIVNHCALHQLSKVPHRPLLKRWNHFQTDSIANKTVANSFN